MIRSLQIWIRQTTIRVRDNRGRCIRISLRHMAGRGTEVQQFEIEKQMDENEADSIADEIEATAFADASAFGGVQKYCAVPFFENFPDKADGRLVFRMTGDEDAEADDGSSEPPNMKGLISQQMRHNESLVRAVVLGSQNIINGQARIIDRYQGLQEQLLGKYIEAAELIAEIQNNREGRALEEKKADHKQLMLESTLDRVSIILPHIVNRIAGRKILPEPATAISSFGELRRTLTQEQMTAIMGQLTVEQQIALADALQAVDAEQEKEKAKKVSKK